MHYRAFVVAALVAAGSTACTDSTSPPDAVVGETAASIHVSASEVRTGVSDAVRVTAVPRSRAGRPIEADVEWASDDPSVAVVEDGLIVPLSPGQTRVVARAGQAMASISVTVPFGNVRVKGVRVTPDSASVQKGKRLMVLAMLQYTNNVSVSVRTSAKWSSLNSAIATVAKGTVIGVAPGTTAFVASIAGVSDTSVIVVPGAAAPAPVPSTKKSYYAAPNGSATGDGSLERPWSLAVALAHPRVVEPGDTIWLRGGTYKGTFRSLVKGSAEAPIVVRQYPNERATVDGRLEIEGRHAWYWGFEVTYSDTKRVTSMRGSDPGDLSRERVTVFVTGPFTKLINLTVHDLGDGVFASSWAEGLEIYGTLLYNNGWDAPDRGHGHSLYLQNQGATKRIVDNVMFNSFSTGLKVGGSGDSYLWNFHIEGNTSFQSGAPVQARHGLTDNMHHEGGGGKLGRSRYDRNSFYHSNGVARAFRINAPGDPAGEDLTFTRNIVQGKVEFNEWRNFTVTNNKFTSGEALLSGQDVLVGFRVAAQHGLRSHTWHSNAYAVPSASPKKPFYMFNGSGALLSFDEWKRSTGYDAGGTYTSAFTGSDVIVRPNVYEPGRAFVTVWNWNEAGSVSVDLSDVLRTGDRYTVHHVYDVFGAPVAEGTYNGGSISLRQTGHASPIPHGYGTRPAASGTRFNVFLVRKRS